MLVRLFVTLALFFGSLSVAQADFQKFSPMTLQNAATATGNGSQLPVDQYGGVAAQVTISATATVTFETTVDGTNWVSAACTSVADTSSQLTSTATASGVYQCNVSGMALFRARISSYGSGTVTVYAKSTTAVMGKKGGASGQLTTVTAFPSSPFVGQIVIVTDDSAVGACDSAAGSSVTLCRWDGAAWLALGDGATTPGGSLTAGSIDTSAELDAIVTDDTGSGALVFGTSPTLTTPTLTTPTINGTIGGTAAITATGGSTARTLTSRFAERGLSVKDKGAVCDEVTDDATAIQATIDVVGAAGGGGVLIPAKCAIATGLINTYNNVLLEGLGAGGTQNVDPDLETAISALVWTGAAGGVMYDMGPTVAVAHKVQGGGITKIYFDGGGTAAKAVNLRSVVGAKFDFVVADTTGVGLDIDVEDTVTADSPDTQSNIFSHVTCNNQAAGTGICVRLAGGTSSDTSINKFGMLRLLHYDGVALDVGQSGGNIFEHVYIVRTGAGTGIGVLLRAGTAPNLVEKTVFVYLQPGHGGLTSQGLASGSTAATNNTVLYYSRANASPAPVVELGSSLNYWDSLGNWRMSRDSTFPILDLHRSTSSTGQLGKYNGIGYNSSSAEVSYANIGVFNNTNTAGAEVGELRFVTKNAGADVTQATIVDGIKIGTPTGSTLGAGTLNLATALYKNGSSLTGVETVTYSASMAINQRNGSSHLITPTDGVGFTIGAPSNDIAGDLVTIVIDNTFGTLGTATWNAAYKLQSTWVQPSNGQVRGITFLSDGGTNLKEISRTTVAGAGLGDVTDVIAGVGITVATPTGPSPTVTWAPETQVNSIQVFDGSQASRTITYGVTGTDPVLTVSASSVDLTTGTLKQGGVAVTTDASVSALTNKTLDCTDASNVCTIPEERWFDVAGCNDTVAGPILDVPTANAAVPLCDTGTNTQKGVLGFDASIDQATHYKFRLKTGFTGAIDYIFRFKMVSATSGTIGWCAQLIRVAVGASSDPAFPAQAAGNCVSVTVPGTAGLEAEATLSGATCTSCAAGDLVYARITRDANGGAVSDTATGDGYLIGFLERTRRAM